MNVFFIPSWYPCRTKPYFGIFCQEQARALARAGHKVFLVSWGQLDYYLNPRHPIQSCSALGRFLREPSELEVSEVETNLVELRKPCLEWTHKISGGNVERLTATCEACFRHVTENLGVTIDLIHAQVCMPAGVVARNLAQSHGLPYVVTEHMGPFPWPKYVQSKGELYPPMKRAYQDAARVIAVSTHLLDALERYGVEGGTVIPNLVDTDRFRIGPERHDEFTFFTQCNMAEIKRIPDLLNAVRIVVNSRPEIQFRLGGNGPELELYRDAAERLGLEDNVRFLGTLTDAALVTEMQKANAFVLTSRQENFGVVYIEALSCGKPILATRCEGPESIVNELNGLLVEVGDIEGIADGLLKIVDNYDDYDPEKIREDCQRRFSYQTVAEQITSIYRDCGEVGKKYESGKV